MVKSIANEYKLKVLRKAIANYKPRECVMGVKNGNFVSGKEKRYVRIGINKRKVRRSHMIWRIYTGKKIPKGYEIHHMNGDECDDRIENLAIVVTRRNLIQYKNKVEYVKPSPSLYNRISLLYNSFLKILGVNNG